MNAALFYENPNPKEYISLVPTSAHSGDGMGNLIALLCHYSQTFLAKRVAVTDDLQATVMEVKALPGLGEFYAALSKLADRSRVEITIKKVLHTVLPLFYSTSMAF